MADQKTRSHISNSPPKTELPGAATSPQQRRASLHVLSSDTRASMASPRRFSLAVSNVCLQDDEDPSLTSSLPLTIDPHEKERIDQAIHDIQEETDPTEQARKSTIFLANLQVLHANRFNVHVERTSQQTQNALSQLEQGLANLQQTEQRMHSTVEHTHATQKRLRNMAYVSFTLGILGFGLIVYNGIKDVFSENN